MEKATLKAMRHDINEALIGVVEKYELEELQAGNARFSNSGAFTFQLKGLEAGGLSERAEKYNQRAALYDLPPLGTVIEIRGKKLSVSGWISEKNVECESGGTFYKVKLDTVKRLAGTAAASA